LISFVFIDFTEALSPGLINSILFLQFIPSLLAFINIPALYTSGFIFVLIMTLLFGRVYCSSVCPVGTLQDAIGFLKRKLRRKTSYRFKKANNILRYTVLGISVLFIALGSLFFLNLLDPFSNYGRIAANLFKPLYIGLNNFFTSLMEGFGIYKLYYIKQIKYNWISLVFPAFFLLTLFVLVFRRGRIYCNTICPLGTFLGLISRYALLRIQINKEACTVCAACSLVCKAECIDLKKKEIDNSRCVNCHNCFGVCAQKGINYRYSGFKAKKKMGADIKGRRNSILTIAPLFLFVAFRQKNRVQNQSGIRGKSERKNAITPPGSIGHEHFTTFCTACHLCVSSCPSQVIKPSLFEYGLEGVLQPMMDYQNAYCLYECTRCGDVCPSGAIMPLLFEEKRKIQIGVAKLNKNTCVVYRDRIACGACAEHCPTKAVSMQPYIGYLTVPVIRPELCVGCGACEYACPTSPKAIYVEGHYLHKEAIIPVSKEQESTEHKMEDFPF
jgi:ferredoxin-type protein NapF